MYTYNLKQSNKQISQRCWSKNTYHWWWGHTGHSLSDGNMVSGDWEHSPTCSLHSSFSSLPSVPCTQQTSSRTWPLSYFLSLQHLSCTSFTCLASVTSHISTQCHFLRESSLHTWTEVRCIQFSLFHRNSIIFQRTYCCQNFCCYC